MNKWLCIALVSICTSVLTGGALAQTAFHSADRYVADAMEITTLPGGEVATRLVSTAGRTARQFWVDSVYGTRNSVVVFGSHENATPVTAHTDRSRGMDREPNHEQALEERPGNLIRPVAENY